MSHIRRISVHAEEAELGHFGPAEPSDDEQASLVVFSFRARIAPKRWALRQTAHDHPRLARSRSNKHAKTVERALNFVKPLLPASRGFATRREVWIDT